MLDSTFWITVLTIVVVMGAMLTICAYLIYVERKIAAWVQDRVGPNRVGPFGLLQPLADGLKFLFKEDIIPARVDKLLFLLAPAIAVSTALFAFAVVPFGPTSRENVYQFVIAPGLDIGRCYPQEIARIIAGGQITQRIIQALALPGAVLE